MFGKSKEDTSQDKHIKDIWKFLQALNKNQATIVKNQNTLIQNNTWFIQRIRELQTKDKHHDAKDAEIETMIQGIKDVAKAIETTEEATQTE